LADEVRTIALDLPGFGESDPVGGGDVMAEHVATVKGLLDHLGLARAVIVGHSMGGLVTTRLARDHPDRVAGVALTDAGSVDIGATRLALIVMAFRVFNVVFRRRVGEFVARTPWLRAVFMALAVADRRCVSTELAMRIIPRMASPGFIETLEAAAAAANEVTAEEITCPALVIWGMRDRILSAASGRELASRMPDARFVPLQRVGHCPMLEVPERLSRLIADFAHDPANGRPAGDDSLTLDTRTRRWRLRRSS
jgi:pimeloyl-ACP methyl ester carboxylesterase